MTETWPTLYVLLVFKFVAKKGKNPKSMMQTEASRNEWEP